MKFVIAAALLFAVGCSEKKPTIPTVPAPPELVHIKGSCILGALADAKSCDVVKVKGIGPALDCRVLITMKDLACVPAVKK